MSSTTSSSASSPASAAGNPRILTPSRRVKDILAQFSDSDTDASSPRRASNSQIAARRSQSQDRSLNEATSSHSINHNDTSMEDSEAKVQGRVAARLQGDSPDIVQGVQPKKSYIQTNELPVLASAQQLQHAAVHDVLSEDELVMAMPRRTPVMEHTEERTLATSRSPSPLFMPQDESPLSHKTSSPASRAQSTPPKNWSTHRSKFLALVDKHRKNRIEREAAEVARKAAGIAKGSNDDDDVGPVGQQRGQRGSSPADDSDEDGGSSDDNAAARISTQARPTRKASKKAIEEMNRETQRMSRNMQLAHQARTRTKISKESLLRRFGFASAATTSEASFAEKWRDDSSSGSSDHEANQQTDTPPTSPLQVSHLGGSKETLNASLNRIDLHGGLSTSDGMAANLTDQPHRISADGQEKVQCSPRTDQRVLLPPPNFNVSKLDATVASGPTPRTSIVRSFAMSRHNDTSNSDEEIEIVQDRGLKRKYAAFETLPKRKSKETPSHLALRSLAQLLGDDTKKKTMNTAEMEASLRARARLQAKEERLSKIELLKAKGVIIQTAEERERDQQAVEDLVERARQEATEIQKREKELAKKAGTYVKDALDEDEDDSEDDDFVGDDEELDHSGSDDEAEQQEEEHNRGREDGVIDDEAEDASSQESAEELEDEVDDHSDTGDNIEDVDASHAPALASRNVRFNRIVHDDDEEEEEVVEQEHVPNDKTQYEHGHHESLELPPPAETPQSAPRSAKKIIPGLQMSDDLPMGLSQAFAATMADSQPQDFAETQAQDSLNPTADLPSPHVPPTAPLRRLDSIDLISDSLPATQTQPLDVELSLSQNVAVPESPAQAPAILTTQVTPSQRAFDLTQDAGYMLSPFAGSRFAESPRFEGPQSTVDTVIVPPDGSESPLLQRKGRLRRGRTAVAEDPQDAASETAFQVMQRAAKRKAAPVQFDKGRSEARNHIDEAAEESEDEYAGLGGVSDDEEGEENDDDRQMIDEDTQVGAGDEAKLAALYADRERARDEQDVSKLLKDITTGALRRKRGVADDLDLSDEEDATARRREAKRREFARMRRELLKDEAVGKIAEDKKKEAFLRSIEDRDAVDDDDEDHDFDRSDTQQDQSQSQSQDQPAANDVVPDSQTAFQIGHKRKRPLAETSDSRLNAFPAGHRRDKQPKLTRKPTTLAEIRESVSFLIEEPDSQAALVDLGLSDSEDEPEAYVNLDRHFKAAADEPSALEDDTDDLGDFIVDDNHHDENDSQDSVFKKPGAPASERAPFHERRTQNANVIDRLSLLRQASSSSGSTLSNPGAASGTRMAFLSGKSTGSAGFPAGVPSLLRRATTNSSLGSMSGRDHVSATGVTTAKTERGAAGHDKEFIRKAKGSRSSAVNFQARETLKDEKMRERAGLASTRGRVGKSKRKASTAGAAFGPGGFLGGLFRGDSWE